MIIVIIVIINYDNHKDEEDADRKCQDYVYIKNKAPFGTWNLPGHIELNQYLSQRWHADMWILSYEQKLLKLVLSGKFL